MLVLTRRVGDIIQIGDSIEIKIIDISPSRIRVGIVAPRDMTIQRGEVREAAEQNRLAAKPVSVSSLATLVNKLHSRKDTSKSQ